MPCSAMDRLRQATDIGTHWEALEELLPFLHLGMSPLLIVQESLSLWTMLEQYGF